MNPYKELAALHHDKMVECLCTLRSLADATKVLAAKMDTVAKDFKDIYYRYSSDPEMLRLELQIVMHSRFELKDMSDDMMYWINSRYETYKEIKENEKGVNKK